jgi:hypothetical protein
LLGERFRQTLNDLGDEVIARANGFLGVMMVRSKRMGTPDAIKNTAHGREVGQGIDVDVANVGTEIPGFTVRNYRPPGSQ